MTPRLDRWTHRQMPHKVIHKCHYAYEIMQFSVKPFITIMFTCHYLSFSCDEQHSRQFLLYFPYMHFPNADIYTYTCTCLTPTNKLEIVKWLLVDYLLYMYIYMYIMFSMNALQLFHGWLRFVLWHHFSYMYDVYINAGCQNNILLVRLLNNQTNI